MSAILPCVHSFPLGSAVPSASDPFSARLRGGPSLFSHARWSWLLALLAGSPNAHAAFDSAEVVNAPLAISRITPSGEDVPAARQVVIAFNRAVVPIGRMERRPDEVPVRITPALECQWRWLDPRNLACQLGTGSGMRAATRYHVEVSADLRTYDGASLPAAVQHRFVTQRPAISWVQFRTWRSPGWPVMRLVFNQPVTRGSVLERVFFARGADDPARTGVTIALPGESPPTRIFDLVDAAPIDLDTEPPAAPSDASGTWLIEPQRELALDTTYRLEVDAGLRSAEGPEPGVARHPQLVFDTFPAFRFLGVRCLDRDSDEWVVIAPAPTAQSEAATDHQCDPMRGTGVTFSAPVAPAQVKEHLHIHPDLAAGRTDYDPWANRLRPARLSVAHRRGGAYTVWLPERLRAFDTYRLRSAPGALRDAFGRTLSTGLELQFRTAHRRPRLVLEHRLAVLKQGVDSDVPLYVTNLERVELSYRTLTADGASPAISASIEVPPVVDSAFAIPMGVRERLDGRSGALAGRISASPRPEIDGWRFFAQVTPFQVHVKLGHFSSLAWITRLDSGLPVAGARVYLYEDTYTELDGDTRSHGSFVSNRAGVATLPGTDTVDPEHLRVRAHGFEERRLFVRVEHEGELAVLPLDYGFRTHSTGAWPNGRIRHGHTRAWGTTAQGIYRAGDTIAFKLYVREQRNRGFVPAASGGYSLSIIDPRGETIEVRSGIELSRFGAYAGEFEVPRDGAVGWYRFELGAERTELRWHPLRVLVSDFTTAPFKVSTELAGARFGPGDRVAITTAARLHAGGPYVGATARVNARVQALAFRSAHPVARRFRFATTAGNRTWYDIHQSEAGLDENGERRHELVLPDPGIHYGRLHVESAVRDERGKYVASAARADYVDRDRFVGLRNTRWVHEEDEVAVVEYIVVDPAGEPLPDVLVAVLIEREVVHAARVKGAGNAYLTRYEESWVAVGQCRGESRVDGTRCAFTPSEPGTYRAIATVADNAGREHRTELGIWVRGKGQVFWRQPANNSLTIIPERARLEVGARARYLVRNPYPGATALVTLERYGVLRSWTQVFETSTPVVEVPIEPDLLPGFYLSVLVVSPRVESPGPVGRVDLGKPAYRLGYVAVEVDDPYHRIDVEPVADRATYKPGETVHLRLRAVPRQGPLHEPIEFAVAVLDDAVFDLIRAGRRYFDPYRGFYRLEALDVFNYGLLQRLVGRQRFETKGANAGGDGGAGAPLRSDFDFVAYWNPSVVADVDGQAEVTFDLPDNLTAWRVLALAVTPGGRMGLGEATFTVNQPIELRPVMPNQVREGDRFEAGFSVMNRTAGARSVAVTIEASGSVAGTTHTLTRELVLEPFRRVTVYLPIETAGPGSVTFHARAGDAVDGDATTHVVPVKRRRSLVTAASYGTTTTGPVRERVKVPLDVHPDAGTISVVASASVIGHLEGAFRYMRDYPYRCWEQRLSKGVMAAHFVRLRDYLPASLAWPQAARLAQHTLESARSFQAPNGGMAYWVPQDRYVSPYLSAYTALGFHWLRKAGHAIPAAVEDKLHRYLETMLRHDAWPGFYSRGMAGTVRATALAALSAAGRVDDELLRRYRPHAPYMSLFGRIQYLDAARRVEGGGDVIGESLEAILAHAVESGGKLQLNETIEDGHRQLLATPGRTLCAALASLTALGEEADFEAVVAALPFKLVRALTQIRGNRDHWENTQENVFCVSALLDYRNAYEQASPAMRVTAYIDDEPLGEARFEGYRDRTVTLARELDVSDLGADREVSIEKHGAGRLYYATRVSYAPRAPFVERVNAGLDVRREYSVERDGAWMLLKAPMSVRRGELMRVDIYLSLPTARHFVVVDDPVPGGVEAVNAELATASRVDADKGAFRAAGGAWWHQFR